MARNQLIIFVPGVMGSDIYEKIKPGQEFGEENTIWRLLRGGKKPIPTREIVNLSSARVARRMDPTATIADDNLCEVSMRFYGAVMKTLRSAGHIVVPFGYDWRKSNRINGARLRRVIESMYRATGKKIIIITHSMGGYVTRWALCEIENQEAVTASNRVKCVLHYMCPVFGAPDAFCRAGAGWKWPTGFVFGFGAKSTYPVHKKWKAWLEILPNNEYMEWARIVKERGDWLKFSDNDDIFAKVAMRGPRGEGGRNVRWTGLPRNRGPERPSGVYLEYVTKTELQLGEARGVVGATRDMKKLILRGAGEMDKLIMSAERFHSYLADRYHPVTSHFYSTGIPTPVGVRIHGRSRTPRRRLPKYKRIMKPLGDGSVHSASCYDYLKNVVGVPAGSVQYLRDKVKHDHMNAIHDTVRMHVEAI